MSCLKVLSAALALGAVVGTATAQTTRTNMFLNVSKPIPDGQPTGVSDTEILNFSDPLFASITNVEVVLDISGGFNGDLYGYLVHDSGFAVLLNRVGRTAGNPAGYSDEGMNVTLSASGNDIHGYQMFSVPMNGDQLTGTWSPDGRETDPQYVSDTSARTALLGSFNGGNPNGAWTLFLADVDFGQQGTLVQWGVIISAIPEPSTCVLMGLGGLTLGMRWLRRRASN